MRKVGQANNAGVRLQPRDWEVAGHLQSTRALSTQQIAALCFEGRFHAAQARLYLLRKKGFLKNSTGHGTAGCVWELARKTFFTLVGYDRSHKYPRPLGPFQVEHLIAANDLYVTLFHCLQYIAGVYEGDWAWTGEPRCHREYVMGEGSDMTRYVLKPDVEIEIFEHLYLIERQTTRAKERPEKLHDKTFGYHRFANSPERKSDPRKMILLWACDEERDARTALEARGGHPTKSPRKLGMRSFHTERMSVQSGSPHAVANFICGEARRLS